MIGPNGRTPNPDSDFGFGVAGVSFMSASLNHDYTYLWNVLEVTM